ncbi:MAG: hypothetical protein RL591_2399 [Planctomycetota bacterium]
MAIRKSATRMKSLWASRTYQSDQRLTSMHADAFDQTDVVGSFEFETDLAVDMSNETGHGENSARNNAKKNEKSQDSFQDAYAGGGQCEGQHESIIEIQIGDARANSGANLGVDSRGISQSGPCESLEFSGNERIEQTTVCVEVRDQECAQQSRRLRRLGYRNRHRDRHRDITTAIRKALTRCDEGRHQSVRLDVMDTSQSHTTPFSASQFSASQFLTCLRESLATETGQQHCEATVFSTEESARVHLSQNPELCGIRSNAMSYVQDSHLLVPTGLSIDAVCGGLVCGALHELRDLASQAAVASGTGFPDTGFSDTDFHRSDARIVPFGIIAHLACCALVTPEIGGEFASGSGGNRVSVRTQSKVRRSQNVSASDELAGGRAFVVWIGDRVRPSDALFKAFEGYKVPRRRERTQADIQTGDHEHAEIPQHDGSACMQVHGRISDISRHDGLQCRSLASCSIFLGDADERGACAKKNRKSSLRSRQQQEDVIPSALRASSAGSDSDANSRAYFSTPQSTQEYLGRTIGGKLSAPELRVWSAEHFLRSGSPGVLIIDGDNFNAVCWRRLQLAASQASAPVLVLIVTSSRASASCDMQAQQDVSRDTPTSRAVATRWDIRASAAIHAEMSGSVKPHADFGRSVLHGASSAAFGFGFEWTMTLRALRGRAAIAMQDRGLVEAELTTSAGVRSARDIPVLAEGSFEELAELNRQQYEKLGVFCRVSAIEDGVVRGRVVRPRTDFGEAAWARVSAMAAARQASATHVDREGLSQASQRDLQHDLQRDLQNGVAQRSDGASILIHTSQHAEMHLQGNPQQDDFNRISTHEIETAVECLEDISSAAVCEARQGWAA